MTLTEAKKVLEDYNAWRRHEGEPTDCPHSALKIGAAIDLAVHTMWKMDKINKLVAFGKGPITDELQ